MYSWRTLRSNTLALNSVAALMTSQHCRYSYQQACPYYQKKGKTTTSEKANCAADQPFGQPDWVAPPAAAVLFPFATKGVASGAWPVVAMTVRVAGVPSCATAVTMAYSVLSTNDTTPANQPPPSPTKTITLTADDDRISSWQSTSPFSIPFGMVSSYHFAP